jgi:hypothetical protein
MDNTTYVSAKTSLIWVIVAYVALALVAIAGPESQWVGPAFILIAISWITMPITAWRRRRDFRLSVVHRLAFFGALAFWPLFVVVAATRR